jgi:sugar lactone lactonase YvrE
MPGARWHRDTTYFHTVGSGVGYVNDPRGMAWTDVFPSGLFVADLGNNSGQKLSDRDTTGFFRYEQDGDGSPITGPQDITVDASGYVYVCDTGNRRVLRYDPSGNFVQRVDVEADDLGATLLQPVAVAANDSIAYIADFGRGEVIRYERRK